ncbi:unnamed protein product [Vitrella brassicaformis CCMP3155]|uniref:Uncharacterized protein n=1 Tax=Vitrella brassicaformis (strain CCMP3155) TaxID=1169540 RepID=A0A0G4H1V9_VITBC|nr:unnamed protein product [Vitrella brassicaformis CCMP3155]|eukprot:CEM37386.1 unnamed protein product [Vitrella brassicaformis CCMP3155]
MSDSEVHQQPSRSPFSRGRAPAFALSATKELAYGIHHGALSHDTAAQLLTQEKADPNRQYYNRRNICWASLLHLAAEKCVGEDGGAGADMDGTSSLGRLYMGATLGRHTTGLGAKPPASCRPALSCPPLTMIETLLRHGAKCGYSDALASWKRSRPWSAWRSSLA